jgi:polar amino acid transport system permease protein
MLQIYTQKLIATLPFFLKGFWVTVWLSALCIVTGTIWGFAVGLLRVSSIKVVRMAVGFYSDIIRGTPFLVQIFFIYFIFPEWGIQLEPIEAAILALTLLHGGFICEIVAAGIKMVPKGQEEAAKSSGLNSYQRMRHIILPQAMPGILSPLAGQYVSGIKESAVISVIGVMDVTRVGWLTVQRIPQGLLVFSLVALFYFIICYPTTRLIARFEKQTTVKEATL